MQTSPSPSWTASGRLITRVIPYRLRTYGYCATRGMFSRCWTWGLSVSNPGRVSSGSRSGTLGAKSGLYAGISRVRGGQRGRFFFASCGMSYSRVNKIFSTLISISSSAIPLIFTDCAGVPCHIYELLSSFQVQPSGATV